MKLLLDTNALVWISQKSPRIEPILPELLSPQNQVFFSTLNLWEIAIKNKVSRPTPLVEDVYELYLALLASETQELSITARHVLFTEKLDLIHRDPFDRLLIAQAICENMTIVTADRQFAQYAVETILI